MPSALKWAIFIQIASYREVSRITQYVPCMPFLYLTCNSLKSSVISYEEIIMPKYVMLQEIMNEENC